MAKRTSNWRHKVRFGSTKMSHQIIVLKTNEVHYKGQEFRTDGPAIIRVRKDQFGTKFIERQLRSDEAWSIAEENSAKLR